jgi:hypothetical protein
MALVRTKDNVEFFVNRDLVEEIKLIRMVSEDTENDVIPLHNVDSEDMVNIMHFSNYGSLKNYDKIKKLIITADYINYDRMLEHCAHYIATKVIKGMTPKQIQEYFNN